MKKLSILLILLFISALSYSQTIDQIEGTDISTLDQIDGADISTLDQFDGSDLPSLVWASDCDCSGTVKFCWEMENSAEITDPDNGCVTSGGNSSGIINGSPAFSQAVGTHDGSNYSLLISAQNDYYRYSVSSNNLVDPDDFKITWDIYIVNRSTGGSFPLFLFEVRHNASNYLRCYDNGSTGVSCYRNGSGTGNVFINVSVPTGQWVSCEYQGKVGVPGNDHYLACGDQTREQNNNLAADEDGTNLLYIGSSNLASCSSCGPYHIDNIEIDLSDRY